MQSSLFEISDLAPVVPEDDPRAGTMLERAVRFHARNPHIYRGAVAICRRLKARGVQHYGIGAIWEVLRFEYVMTFGDIYKLNNNFRAWYAREIMATEPDLAGFFSTRECPNDPDYHARAVRS